MRPGVDAHRLRPAGEASGEDAPRAEAETGERGGSGLQHEALRSGSEQARGLESGGDRQKAEQRGGDGVLGGARHAMGWLACFRAECNLW